MNGDDCTEDSFLRTKHRERERVTSTGLTDPPRYENKKMQNERQDDNKTKSEKTLLLTSDYSVCIPMNLCISL